MLMIVLQITARNGFMKEWRTDGSDVIQSLCLEFHPVIKPQSLFEIALIILTLLLILTEEKKIHIFMKGNSRNVHP